MPKNIAAFGEDFAHKTVIDALITRVANELRVPVRVDWRNARRGHGKVVSELEEYFRDLRSQGSSPDFVVVATDANCKGLNERSKQIPVIKCPVPVVLAIPDPHIERWLLLDGAAFKAALGRGCNAPDLKCDRDRYKSLLVQAIIATGITPSLGGIEFSEDIISHMDLDRVGRADTSMLNFLKDLRRRLG